MAKTKTGVINAVNYVRANASQQYQAQVPVATANTPIQIIADPILNYEPFMNEFIDGLVNRIALTKISNMVFSNPLSVFRKGSVPLGTDIQDIFTNPAQRQQYEMNDVAMSKLLTVDMPDTKVAYYRRNRQDMYPVTISNEQLTGAFVSWEKLEELIASITNSLYSGNYIDEFNYTKSMLNSAFEQNKVLVETADFPEDQQTANEFLKLLRGLYAQFKFPSTQYNAWSRLGGSGNPVTTWTTDDRICVIIRADVMAALDVEAMAAAFNIDSAKLLGRIYQVDKFDNEGLYGFICDESFLQIYQNNFKFTTFYNARTMTWNYYLHSWDTFQISPFANCVAICETGGEPSVPATSITINSTDLTITKNVAKTFNVSVLPKNSTDELTVTPLENVTTSVAKQSDYTYNVTVTVANAFVGGTATLQLKAGSQTQNLQLTVS